ncbi:MAG: rhamnulokinase, partial [Propionibacteriaceae bacterium]|nr:rhamnulokinase [Propionibacteriaceae bacterium]
AAETGQTLPDDPVLQTRCVLDSLALVYRRTIREAAALSGIQPRTVHVVGGGCLNALLCQLTADAVGLPVVAGPVEGAALGNLLVQARTLGALSGGLAELRRVVAASVETRRFGPGVLVAPAQWDAAARRLGKEPA